jgi:hypothetical protein
LIDFLGNGGAVEERTKTNAKVAEHWGERHPYPFHFYRGGYSDSGRSASSKTVTRRFGMRLHSLLRCDALYQGTTLVGP